MLQYVDDTLYQLFANGLTTLSPGSGTTSDQIRFQPPDAAWRSHLSNLGTKNALNVYLVDLRENRRLRSSSSNGARTVDLMTGRAGEESAPARVNCHYLLTAWSNAPADPTRTTIGTGTAEEHAILYEVMALLMANQPLVPADVYAPGPVPPSVPPLLAQATLPTEILPVEGFPKYAEFWGTMGEAHAVWKPAVYLVVTVPVALPPQPDAFVVTTRVAGYGIAGDQQTLHTVTQIGGRVTTQPRGSATPQPVSDAWVRLEQANGVPVQTTMTGVLGVFTFENVQWGSYALRVRSSSHPEAVTQVHVPATAIDGYDVMLT